MTSSIPDGKCQVFNTDNIFDASKTKAGYHLGPVAPSASDGASLALAWHNTREHKMLRNVLLSDHPRGPRPPDQRVLGDLAR